MKWISNIGLLAFSACFAAGCSHSTPKPVYKAAIEGYYHAHPAACLWMSEKTFPLTASADDAKNNGYGALADQGLLTRAAAKHHETTFNLSATGQQFWVADPSNSGAGNLCYGHRAVVSIDNASATPDQPGYSTMVSYHYTITDAPAWASSPEIRAAFPMLANDAKPQMSIATLTNTDNGWQMNPPAAGQSASTAMPGSAGGTQQANAAK